MTTKIEIQASSLQILNNGLPSGSESIASYQKNLCDEALRKGSSPRKSDGFKFALENGVAINKMGDGFLNLAAFVRNPFSRDVNFDFTKMEESIGAGYRLLDNLHLGHSVSPPVFYIEGLADALVMMGEDYSSSDGRKQAERLVRAARNYFLDCSVRLSKERGAIDGFNADLYFKANSGAALPVSLIDDIKRHGLRSYIHLCVGGGLEVAMSFFNGASPNITPPYSGDYDWPVTSVESVMSFVSVENYANRVFRLVTGYENENARNFKSISETYLSDIEKMRKSIAPFVDGGIAPIEGKVRKYSKGGKVSAPRVVEKQYRSTNMSLSLAS